VTATDSTTSLAEPHPARWDYSDTLTPGDVDVTLGCFVGDRRAVVLLVPFGEDIDFELTYRASNLKDAVEVRSYHGGGAHSVKVGEESVTAYGEAALRDGGRITCGAARNKVVETPLTRVASRVR
jgi:hypothetical protein